MKQTKGRTAYIQRRSGAQLETIDELPANTREERKEVRRIVMEYNLSDPTARHYASSRPCKGWSE